MADPITAMRAVADRLDPAGVDYAFVGGCIVNLLLDHPGLAPARPTDDVDVIVEVTAGQRYSDLEAKLRALGFQHDMTPDAPKCRWKLGDLTVDVMPTEGTDLGLNTQWFAEALAGAEERTVRGDVRLRLIPSCIHTYNNEASGGNSPGGFSCVPPSPFPLGAPSGYSNCSRRPAAWPSSAGFRRF